MPEHRGPLTPTLSPAGERGRELHAAYRGLERDRTSPGAPPWIDANAGFSAASTACATTAPDWSALLEAGLREGQGQGAERPGAHGAAGGRELAREAVDLGNSPEPIDLLLELVSKMSTERDFSVWQHGARGADRARRKPASRRGPARLPGLRGPSAAAGRQGARLDGIQEGDALAPLAARGRARRPDRAGARSRHHRAGQGPACTVREKPRHARPHPCSLLVLTSAARNGNAALWDRFRARMDGAKDLELRDRYRAALKRDWRPRRSSRRQLELTLTEVDSASRTSPTRLGALLENPLAHDQDPQIPRGALGRAQAIASAASPPPGRSCPPWGASAAPRCTTSCRPASSPTPPTTSTAATAP